VKRVAVVGPGAVGATMAAVAARAGAELVVCGRTAYERLVVEGSIEQTVPGPVVTDPAALDGPVDVLLLAVKAHQTAAAAPFLRALCGDGTIVVVLQNGVEQRELAGPHVGGAVVVPAVVWFPAETIGPGHVRLRGAPRVLLPDEPPAHTVAALLEGVEVTADFVTEAWRKLTVNAVAGLMAVTGRRAAIFRRADVAALARALALECLAVARAEGADLGDEVAAELLDWFAELPEDAGTSILADREAGRPLEWDARNGVVARRGAAHGLPTPVSDVIVPLLAATSTAAG
jgi:2-dehydropantoate 2-reductase